MARISLLQPLCGFFVVALAFGAPVVAQDELKTPSLAEKKMTALADYPTWALREAHQGAFLAELWVTPKGRPYECQIVASIGSELLGAELCRQLARKRFEPALLSDGTATYGVTRLFQRYMLPDEDNETFRKIFASKPQPDLEINVTSLPDRAGELDVKLAIVVSPTGAVQQCTKTSEASEALAVIACQQASQVTWPVLQSENKAAVAYVRGVEVRFKLSEAS